VDAVILSPRCADPLYRRAIKVSMGAVFAIPYARMTDWRGGLAEIRGGGFRLLALTPDQAALPVARIPAGPRVALLLGTEGDGLRRRLTQRGGRRGHRLPRAGARRAPGARLTGAGWPGRPAPGWLPGCQRRVRSALKNSLESLRHRNTTAPRPTSQVRIENSVPAAAPVRDRPKARNKVSIPKRTVPRIRAQFRPALFIMAIQIHRPMPASPNTTDAPTRKTSALCSWLEVRVGSALCRLLRRLPTVASPMIRSIALTIAPAYMNLTAITTEPGGSGRADGSGGWPAVG